MSDDMKDAMRNELARREEAGYDARVSLVGDTRFKHLSDEQLVAAIRAYEAARGGERERAAKEAQIEGRRLGEPAIGAFIADSIRKEG